MSEAVNKELPEGWESVPLKDAVHVILGQSPKSSTYNVEGEGLSFFQGKTEFGEIYPTVRKWCTVENEFNGSLEWERLDDKRACRIKSETKDNIFNEEEWEAMIIFMTDSMARLEKTLKDRILEVGNKLKSF